MITPRENLGVDRELAQKPLSSFAGTSVLEKERKTLKDGCRSHLSPPPPVNAQHYKKICQKSSESHLIFPVFSL